MFNSLKLRLFVAKIQAELLAQYNDQNFVNRVCQSPENLDNLNILRQQAYYKKDGAAPFITTCNLLGECIDSEQLSMEDRHICASLLAQRLNKTSNDPSFRHRHIMIFGGLEEKLSAWTHENG